MHRTTMGLVYLLTVVGCASMGGYKPTVDPYNDRHASRIPQDEEECRQLAKQASGGTAKQTAMGGAVGGLLGAATGAAVGAAVGRPGTAAAGGMGGGAYKGLSAEESFKRAFQTCMRNRGHHVIDRRDAPLGEGGTRAPVRQAAAFLRPDSTHHERRARRIGKFCATRQQTNGAAHGASLPSRGLPSSPRDRSPPAGRVPPWRRGRDTSR